jgi:hypothetical protein
MYINILKNIYSQKYILIFKKNYFVYNLLFNKVKKKKLKKKGGENQIND